LDAPTGPGSALKPDRGFPTLAATTPESRCRGPLLNFSSSSEYDRNLVVQDLSALHASPGFLSLQRLPVTGSDIPRGYQTRLRCVFRVSHPLDAFFLPKPIRRISDGNAPGIQLFEGFPFHGHVRPSGRHCPHDVDSNGPPPRGGRRSSLVFRALTSVEVRCPVPQAVRSSCLP